MKLGVIGNRPQELDGFKAYTFHNRIQKELKNKILELKPEVVFTGMALGVEQWAAEICLKNKIPYIVAVPFRDQPKIWKAAQQNRYFYLLKRAENIIYVDRQVGYIDHKPDIYRESKLYAKVDWMFTKLMDSQNSEVIGTYNKNQKENYLFKCWQKVYNCNLTHSILDPKTLEWYTFDQMPIFVPKMNNVAWSEPIKVFGEQDKLLF